MSEQGVRSGPAIDAQHQREAPGAAGGHARDGVLDHDGATGFDLQLARRLEEHVRRRLPGETETVGHVAVDDDLLAGHRVGLRVRAQCRVGEG